jgi:N-methylhydantoinase B
LALLSFNALFLSAFTLLAGVRGTPVEINEAVAPLIFWRKEYRTDSGGAGKQRGGKV